MGLSTDGGPRSAFEAALERVDGWGLVAGGDGGLGQNGMLSPVCWTPENPRDWLNLARSRAGPISAGDALRVRTMPKLESNF